jgi:methyl coenzyme M reductase subunit D
MRCTSGKPTEIRWNRYESASMHTGTKWKFSGEPGEVRVQEGRIYVKVKKKASPDTLENLKKLSKRKLRFTLEEAVKLARQGKRFTIEIETL